MRVLKAAIGGFWLASALAIMGSAPAMATTQYCIESIGEGQYLSDISPDTYGSCSTGELWEIEWGSNNPGLYVCLKNVYRDQYLNDLLGFEDECGTGAQWIQVQNNGFYCLKNLYLDEYLAISAVDHTILFNSGCDTANDSWRLEPQP